MVDDTLRKMKDIYLISICLFTSFRMEVALLGIVVGHHQFLTILNHFLTPKRIASLFRLMHNWGSIFIFLVCFRPLIVGFVVEAIGVVACIDPIRGFGMFISLVVLWVDLFA
jgi:hypothetical protein